MLRPTEQLLNTKFLNKTTKKRRDKRFGLAGWIIGWGIGHYTSLRTIKNNIRALQSQNLLQQDQIIELSHYLNITCLLYTSPSPRDATLSRMPSSA